MNGMKSCRRCCRTGKRWMRNWHGCGRSRCRRRSEHRHTGRITTTRKPRRATIFIDLLLKEAGWALDKPQDREYEVTGMPNNEGERFRGLRAVGRRRQAAGAGGSQTDQA